MALPVNRHTSVKLYGSTGVSTRTGSDFDAVGILDGRLVDTDPLIFARLQGPEGGDRLYLFRNEAHLARAMADPSLAPRAEARWPTLQDQRDRNLSD